MDRSDITGGGPSHSSDSEICDAPKLQDDNLETEKDDAIVQPGSQRLEARSSIRGCIPDSLEFCRLRFPHFLLDQGVELLDEGRSELLDPWIGIGWDLGHTSDGDAELAAQVIELGGPGV